jgi:hypothetical protein
MDSSIALASRRKNRPAQLHHACAGTLARKGLRTLANIPPPLDAGGGIPSKVMTFKE